MRILLISNFYPPQMVGGYERAMADYAHLLWARGHEVHVLTTDVPAFTQPQDPRPAGPPIHRTLQLCGQWTGTAFEWLRPAEIAPRVTANAQVLAGLIAQFQPQVCLMGNIDLLRADILTPLLKAEVPIAHFIMNESPNYPAELAPNSSLYRYLACSDWVRERLAEQGYPMQNAVTVHPGAPVQEFYRENLPKRDCLRIAYASLLMPYKGPHVLLEALYRLHQNGVEFTATLAGGSLLPPFVDSLVRTVAECGMAECVHFPGTLTRQGLKDLYRSHNILVFPSVFQEPFGISQVEAMAAGLTVVSSGTGGAAEIVEDGVSGLIFESENPESLAEALTYLGENPEDWARLSQQGQTRALTVFDQERTVTQLEALLGEMLVATD
ncbi:MAG: glycosyltransferase family 4 protein [Gloeomargaritaceae cyanobacterium C42_A2020_066]|nr:glycosyltransferase family 4 protein [Gloeomargaritaceae cyanobacterium C42_A2020_066]